MFAIAKFRKANLGVIIFLLLVSAACGGRASGPDKAALGWWEAFAKPDRDALSSLTCDAKRLPLELAMNTLALWTDVVPAAIGGVLGVDGFEIDLTSSRMRAEIVSTEGDSATVKVTGQLRPSAMGISGTQNFEYAMKLVRENGSWVVCDDIITTIVDKVTGMDQLGVSVGELAQMMPTRPNPGATLSVDQAVKATIAADNAVRATATRNAELVLTPRPTATPTPLSDEDYSSEVMQALARATTVASLPQSAIALERPEMDREFKFRSTDVTFSPDGKLVTIMFGGDVGSMIGVWDTSSGKLRATLGPLGASFDNGERVFSANGKLLAVRTTSEKRAPLIQIWETDGWSILGSVAADRSLAFTSDGTALLTSSDSNFGDRTFEVWDVRAGSKSCEYEAKHPTSDVTVSDDGALLAYATDNLMRILSVPDCAVVGEIEATGEAKTRVERLVFSPDGGKLGSIEWNGRLRVWNRSDGRVISEFPEESLVSDLLFGPDGKSLAVSHGGLSLWDFEKQTKRFEVWPPVGQGVWQDIGPSSWTFSPDGRYVIIGGNRPVSIYSAIDGSLVADLPFRGALSPGGQMMAVESDDVSKMEILPLTALYPGE